MIIWFIVGSIVWILCVLFMLAIIKGGHRVRGNDYERKLYYRNMVKTRNIENSIKKEMKNTARTSWNQCLPVS